jgi:DNA polymerase III delta subunit
VPVLDVPGLRKQIDARRLAPLYLLVGDDVRLIEQLVDGIEATIDEGDRPFAIDRLYAAEAAGAPVDIAAAARALPMLGDRRIVVVLRAERLFKPKRASKATEVDDADAASEAAGEDTSIDLAALEEYFDKPVPSTTLVFVAADIDRTRRATKRLIEKAHVVVMTGLEVVDPGERRGVQREMQAEIRAEIERQGRAIDGPALQILVERAGDDVSKLRGDVERLLLYTEGHPRISRADVEEIVVVEAIVDDWAMVNAIGDGDVARALRECALRLDRGDSPHQMVGQLRWWVSARLAQAAPSRVRAALDALVETDLALKSSGDERILLERLVIELSGGPARPAYVRRRLTS